jgi:hypothetical protein
MSLAQEVPGEEVKMLLESDQSFDNGHWQVEDELDSEDDHDSDYDLDGTKLDEQGKEELKEIKSIVFLKMGLYPNLNLPTWLFDCKTNRQNFDLAIRVLFEMMDHRYDVMFAAFENTDLLHAPDFSEHQFSNMWEAVLDTCKGNSSCDKDAINQTLAFLFRAGDYDYGESWKNIHQLSEEVLRLRGRWRVHIVKKCPDAETFLRVLSLIITGCKAKYSRMVITSWAGELQETWDRINKAREGKANAKKQKVAV